MAKYSIPKNLKEIDNFDFGKISKENIILEFDFHSINEACSFIFYESSLAHWLIGLTDYAASNSIELRIECTSSIEQIGTSLPGALLSLLAAEGKISGIDRKEASLYREKLFKNQDKWPDLVLSDKTFLICQDSYSKGFPRQLYPDAKLKAVIDPSNFENLVNRMVHSVVSEDNIKGDLLEYTESVSLIIHELFKNTHDHARKTYDGKTIGHSLRGIYCRFYSSESFNNELINHSAYSKNVAEIYSSTVCLPINKNNQLSKKNQAAGVLELSIIDSGSGLASKWSNSDVSNLEPKTQFEYILECFQKGHSSIASSERGYGLWKILQTLRMLKGFIKIRTNSIHCQRQFAILEGRAIEKIRRVEVPMEKMFDWRRGSSEQISDYSEVEGTLISVLIPLDKK